MYMHLNFVFKQALYFSTLAIKLLNSGRKLFQIAINTITLRASLLLKASSHIQYTHF